MARAKPTGADVEKLMRAVLEDLQKDDKLPELMAALIARTRMENPEAARKMVEEILHVTLAGIPEEKRATFLQELMSHVRPS